MKGGITLSAGIRPKYIYKNFNFDYYVCVLSDFFGLDKKSCRAANGYMFVFSFCLILMQLCFMIIKELKISGNYQGEEKKVPSSELNAKRYIKAVNAVIMAIFIYIIIASIEIYSTGMDRSGMYEYFGVIIIVLAITLFDLKKINARKKHVLIIWMNTLATVCTFAAFIAGSIMQYNIGDEGQDFMTLNGIRNLCLFWGKYNGLGSNYFNMMGIIYPGMLLMVLVILIILNRKDADEN
jgi:hypothetical protein